MFVRTRTGLFSETARSILYASAARGGMLENWTGSVRGRTDLSRIWLRSVVVLLVVESVSACDATPS